MSSTPHNILSSYIYVPGNCSILLVTCRKQPIYQSALSKNIKTIHAYILPDLEKNLMTRSLIAGRCCCASTRCLA